VVEDLALGNEGGRSQQPRDGMGEGGLARPALTGEAEGLSPVYDQVDLVHGVNRPRTESVVDREAAYLEQRLGKRGRLGRGRPRCPDARRVGSRVESTEAAVMRRCSWSRADATEPKARLAGGGGRALVSPS
jgi:hypothetical protein